MSVNQDAVRNIFSKSLERVFTNQLFAIVAFSAITIIAAQVSIPANPVPFTLQTLAVVLAGAFLGAKNGAISQLLYIFIGAVGFPVFANGMGGLPILFGPTGGYLIAFPLGALIVGAIVEKYKSYFMVVTAMFLGNLSIILIGTFYLDAFFIKDLSASLTLGAVIFSLWTVIKVFAAASIYFGYKKFTAE